LSELDFLCQDLKNGRTYEKNNYNIHFIGAGGVGMYSLIVLASSLGFSVTGSDREEGEYAKHLLSLGYRIRIGHSEENVKNASLAVYSLAIAEDNPELRYAREKGIPRFSRPEFLGALMRIFKRRIGVSGSHGKTTTTAMLDKIYSEASLLPTTLSGSVLPLHNSPLRLGGRDFLIYEACEYKDAFLSFCPSVSIFTNLELDHVDYFKSESEIINSFAKAASLPEYSVINCDSEMLLSAAEKSGGKFIGYGECERAEYKIRNVVGAAGIYSFDIEREKKKLLSVKLGIPGRFNVYNAAAAAVTALVEGIDKKTIEKALSEFKLPPRRLEKIGKYKGSDVYYDYAHHPTEIEKTINTLREITKERITVIFKPHTYSRTAGFFDEFARALSLADRILICDVAAIREKEISGITSEKLAEAIGEAATRVEEKGIKEHIPDGVVVVMGAAELKPVCDEILD
jgi:UDP-N-acetylmuramate--alanine ligase